MEIEFQSPYGKVSEQSITELENEIIRLWHHKSDMTKAVVCFNEYQNIGSVKNIYCEIIMNFHSGKHYIHSIEDSFERSAMEAAKGLRKMSYKLEMEQIESLENKTGMLVA